MFGWILAGFFLGALPFSVWLGRLFVHQDVRAFGDGNPGAGNAFAAGGWLLGVPVLLLELAKGALPVLLALSALGGRDDRLVPIALAPVLGHAFSPFLHFQGGKAIAASFGVWFALTGLTGPLALAVSMGLFYALQESDAWTVVLGMVGFFSYLVVRGAPASLLVISLGILAIVSFKQRRELRLVVEPRPWLGVRSHL